MLSTVPFLGARVTFMRRLSLCLPRLYSTSENSNNNDNNGAPPKTQRKKRRLLDDKNILSLEDFMFKRRVFKLYRAIVRVSHQAPSKSMADELIGYAKGEFLVSKNVADRDQKRYLLAMGQNQFRDMCKSIGFAFPIHVDFDSIK